MYPTTTLAPAITADRLRQAQTWRAAREVARLRPMPTRPSRSLRTAIARLAVRSAATPPAR